jgi:plastocyanin
MRRFIFPTILGAALLGLLGVPPRTDAQRMMQMSPPGRMQSPSFMSQGSRPGSYMPSQMPGYPMQGRQMSNYQMSGYQAPSYPGSSYDPYSGSQYPSSNSQASQVAVGVYDDLYQSSSIRIAVGTTVVWQNHGRHQQTVTSDDGTWGSGELGTEASYEYTFSQPGLYHYYCKTHPRAMRGTIEVR